jgi:AsmA protein
MRKLLIVVGAVVAVLIIVALILPSLIDANSFRPKLQTELSSALGRNVQVGNISISIFSGGATVDNISIADDPAFSHGTFLTAKQLTVGVRVLPLIFSKSLEVESLEIVDPEVTLLRSASGTWNFSTMGGGAGAKKSEAADPPSSGGSTNLSVGKLTISNGKLSVGTTGSKAPMHVYTAVELKATDLSYTSQFPFKFSADAPGGGKITLGGKAGPINQADTALTPIDATIGVENLDLATTGFIDPSSGLGGLVDFNGTVNSNGQTATAKGTVKTTKLKLTAAGAPASVPVSMDYATEYQLKQQTGTLTQGDVHVGKALARLTGNYETKGETTSVQMKMNGQGMPVPDLEGILPAVGVTLPSGASLQSGTLNADLAINGPVDKLVITGPINLSNGKMSGFGLGSKLGALGPFVGLPNESSSDTEIQTLSANLRIDPSGTHAENLNLVVPTIGTITGNANVATGGKLDCRMVAKLASGASPVGVMTSKYSPLGGGSGGGIPFKIEGTTSNPIFVPDVAGMAGNVTKNPQGAAQGVLGGILKKKIPQ